MVSIYYVSAFGSDRFFRLQSEAVIPDVIKDVNITGWHQACREFRLELNVKINGYSLKAKRGTESGSRPVFPLGGAKIALSELFASAFCRTVLKAQRNCPCCFFPDTCVDAFHKWMIKDGRLSDSQCEQWEATLPHRGQAAKLSKLLAFKHGKRQTTQNEFA